MKAVLYDLLEQQHAAWPLAVARQFVDDLAQRQEGDGDEIDEDTILGFSALPTLA